MTRNLIPEDRADGLTLAVLAGRLAVCRLDADAVLPCWAISAQAARGPLHSVTRTPDELSVVCAEAVVPAGDERPSDLRVEAGWRALRVVGPLDFALVGVLARLAAPLAAADVSVFALATYDTDYLLVRARDLRRAVVALRAAGHRVEESGG